MDKQEADAAITNLISKVNGCVEDILQITGVNDRAADALSTITDTLSDTMKSLEVARKLLHIK